MKKKPTEKKIVEEEYIYDFIEAINKLEKEGWKMHGNFQVRVKSYRKLNSDDSYYEDDTMYSQMMIKK